MRKYRNHDTGPRFITARFDSKCAETGQQIKKGQECLYYPRTQQVYSLESKTVQDWRSAEFDRVCLGAEY
jgi:hypothetical protein